MSCYKASSVVAIAVAVINKAKIPLTECQVEVKTPATDTFDPDTPCASLLPARQLRMGLSATLGADAWSLWPRTSSGNTFNASASQSLSYG